MVSQTRRSFLKRQLALGSCLAAGFDVINGPAYAANTQGYKALVCIYLAGGNDSLNMFVPTTASAHADYASARQFLTVNRAQLLPVSSSAYSDGLAYGFHPAMRESQRLFDTGKLALIANVGSLIRPISKQEYEARTGSVPSQLFSHNDQTDSWLAANANGSARLGWAGRTMDIMYPSGYPVPSPSISISGNTLWQKAQNVRPFEVGRNGVGSRYLPHHSGPIKLKDAYAAMRTGALQERHVFANEHALTLERAAEYGDRLNSALASSPEFTKQFPESPLSAQLKMVARLIAVRSSIDTGLKRQVFFVRIGGWDTHDDQLSGDGDGHQDLLQQLDSALGAFQSAMEELNQQNAVTAFTATEFGRSLTPNGSGTDHGWGGHSMVMGGAVQGGDIYGKMPQVSRDSIDTVENNRLIPTTSVDQYSATMARWFGLTDSELASVFPNLRNFSTPDLGFLG